MNSLVQEQWTKQDLIEVAKRQQAVIWTFIPVGIGGMFIPVIPGIVGCYFVYKLAVALRLSAWLYAVLVFVPFAGIISLLAINGKATKRLQDNGIGVGIIGPNMQDFDKLP